MPMLLVVVIVTLVCIVGGLFYFLVPEKFEFTRLLPALGAGLIAAVLSAKLGPGSAEAEEDTRSRFIDRSRRQQESGSLLGQPFVWLAIAFTILTTVVAFLV